MCSTLPKSLIKALTYLAVTFSKTSCNIHCRACDVFTMSGVIFLYHCSIKHWRLLAFVHLWQDHPPSVSSSAPPGEAGNGRSPRKESPWTLSHEGLWSSGTLPGQQRRIPYHWVWQEKWTPWFVLVFGHLNHRQAAHKSLMSLVHVIRTHKKFK